MTELPTFPEFFRALHGYDSFPWQTRYAEAVASGTPPTHVDVPTAVGKSATVDAHLWACATDPTLPRRLFYVVDRRILIDQTADRAARIVDAITTATDGPLGDVRAALAGHSADLPHDNRVAAVHSLRGGGDGYDRTWLRRPDLPIVICTTVDQLGSAALGRPYLLPLTLAPMAAGLLADSTVVVDEAHLAEPLTETLATLTDSDIWRGPDSTWGRPPNIVLTTATQTTTAKPGEVVTLDAEDHANPVVAARTTTPRRLDTATVATAGRLAGALADNAVRHGTQLAKSSSNEENWCVLVVVNTVADAVKTQKKIRTAAKKAGHDARIVRVTGRQRTADRDRVLDAVAPFLVGGPRDPGTDLYVVATQTVECGVDLDADAGVTAAAPWPSLVQRFGRVNRAARLDAADVTLVHVAGKQGRSSDVVYGGHGHDEGARLTAATATAPVDVCPANLDQHTPTPKTLTDVVVVPPLNRTLVDRWMRNLPDDASHPVAPFLRGLPDPDDPEVHVVWRDLLDAVVTPDPDSPATDDPNAWWPATVDAHRPARDELLPVRIGAAELMLQPKNDDPQPWVRVRHGQPTTVTTDRPAPGDIVVVPTSYGHADPDGWTGNPNDTTTDVSRSRTTPGTHPDRGTVVRLPGPATHGRTILTGPSNTDDGFTLHTLTVTPTDDDVVEREDDQHANGIVLLDEHLSDAERTTRAISTAYGLPDDLVDLLAAAAAVHDLGKNDLRYQQYLGNTHDGPPLGKGTWTWTPAAHRRRAAEAHLHRGWRHEAATADQLPDDTDPLVVWLAATHHGYGRPLWPTTDDGPDLQTRLSDRWSTLHRDLVDRYGPWGLALLETLLRTADWAASANPTRRGANS